MKENEILSASGAARVTKRDQVDFDCKNGTQIYDRLYINCGGESVTVNGTEYEADIQPHGQSTFFKSKRSNWGYSSMGNFLWASGNKYILNDTCQIHAGDAQLYRTARLSSISLKYYGFCLKNGTYDVNLHFAEISGSENKDSHSKAGRLFDVDIQGENVLRNFNIETEAKGVDTAITKPFKANVNNSQLEIHLYWSGKGSVSYPSVYYGPLISAITVTPVRESELPRGVLAGISGFALFLLILFIGFWWRFEDKLRWEELELVELYPGGLYNYKKIKAATKNFDIANRLCEGVSGTVYKGTLSDGIPVAVKKLSETKEGMREFAETSGTIAGIKHPNLVTLMGCCAGKNQLLLIYEYIGTTSLEDALFGSDDELRARLDWQTRCKICLGLAEGLSFLHEGSKLDIIHGDIKPENILLDDDLNPKIDNFGFARLYHKQKSGGTSSYTAPEVKDRPLEASADVYSFAVVMLVLFSGRKIKTPRAGAETVYLVDEAQIKNETETLMELIDQNLNYDGHDAAVILTLAMKCINSPPSSRDTMPTIVEELKKLNSTLIKLEVALWYWADYLYIAKADSFGPRDKELEPVELYPGGLYNYRKIKAATNNFHVANRIGEGGFGTVYKGTLLNGTVVAVKKLSVTQEGMWEFAEKSRAIAFIKHPNLLTLMGCCAEKNQLLLIYEFIGTTSLEDALFGSDDELRKRLDWQTRCEICLGLAEGLAFLHEGSKQEIIHGDIKPAYILLDDDLNPKISDFGFARHYHKQNSEGTMLYTAPEVKVHPLEASADVYSFGVVMLILVSGRKIKTPRAGGKTIYLVDEAQIMDRSGTLMELVDHKLSYDREEAKMILRLAMQCIDLPPLRPTMSTIVKILKKECLIETFLINAARPEGECSIQTLLINAPTPKELEPVELYPGGLYNYRKIKAATNNFHVANRIGEGGFGTVYKGTLSNGTVVAVKKLSATKEGMWEFAEKSRAIVGIKHPNLLTLMGCCAEKNQLLLIYEFIGTTSLEDALFGSDDELRKRLDWQTRCEICLGLAEGLAFLHEGSKQEIIHGDIKPAYILLDDDLNPKISDFGFARHYHKQNSEGTMSYTAPEVKDRPLEASADVYSFGVVMLVLFSGRKIKTPRAGAETVYLVDEAQIMNETGTLMELIDQNLNYDGQDAAVILTLAMKCINSPPSSRDTMPTIVEELKKLNSTLIKLEGD
ncbi:hypothetical protein BC332_10165 [Capsicum chinense]|nr:hypothetical protein BC332_10165 [Capsicum chinense]